MYGLTYFPRGVFAPRGEDWKPHFYTVSFFIQP